MRLSLSGARMKTLLFALLSLSFGMPAFGALQPAKDIVADTNNPEPSIFEAARPHLNRFYSTVLAESRAVKDEVTILQAAPQKEAAKKGMSSAKQN